MESWVDGAVWSGLHHIFSRFDAVDSRRVLLATMDFFRKVAKEAVEKIGYPYPDDVDRNISGFIRNMYQKEENINLPQRRSDAELRQNILGEAPVK